MAGFREFVTGEVLTAANVDDFLMKQSVQKYADAAARDAALGTAVAGGNALREGMVAWLDDEDSVIAYDGTAWNPVGANVVRQIVRAQDSTNRITTSGTFVDTGVNVTITPTRSDSNIILMCSFRVQVDSGTSNNAHLQITDNSNTPIVGAEESFFGTNSSSQFYVAGLVTAFDSPATTSAVTYKTRFRAVGASSRIILSNASNTGEFYAIEVGT